MSYLAHKIQICNWMKGNEIVSLDEVKGDGITNDLKTIGNTISFWEIDELTDLQDVAVSIFTGRDELLDFYVVAIDKDEFEGKIAFKKTDNSDNTAFIKFKDKHYDLIGMDFSKLGLLAQMILDALQCDDNVFDFTYIDSKDYLKQLIDNGKLNKAELKKRVKKDLNIA